MDKRILVVSNSPFSNEEANGRTIKNFLLDIPKRNIAQFYIHGVPDQTFCDHYFRVSDADALNAFLLRKKNAGHRTAEGKSSQMKPKRSYRNLYLRNVIWSSMLWWKKDFAVFLESFHPDVVLLQAGDAPFMFQIAWKVAKMFNAKLMMYNSESYVLKTVMYASTEKNRFWHNCLMHSLRKQYQNFMKHVDFCLYNTDALEEAYQKKYPHPDKSAVLYTTSQFVPLEDNSADGFRLVYCGNLGVGRDQTLNDLAKILYEMDPTAELDIYGKFNSRESQEMLCRNPNVYYRGFVDYSEIPAIMSNASMLLHCESETRVENSRYAFSTKIADSLASTRPLLVYASEEYPFVQYLVKNHCAHVAFNENMLRDVLKNCIESIEYRNRYAANAHSIAQVNHSKENNCRKVHEILIRLFQ